MQTPIQFDNSFASEMEGFYVPVSGAIAPKPEIIQYNADLASELGLVGEILQGTDAALTFSGSKMPRGAASLAQVYAGHQFGGFSPQLGDGRAMMIGEVIDRMGNRRDIQLKGSGPTPFSRNGDGKAVLGPVLREYLFGEAMQALGIPTTRALAAVTTGENVMRERPEKGAVLTRVAASHLRVGTFQFFAARGQTDKVKQLADYAVRRHYPDIAEASNPYAELLERVMERQAELVAKWISVGFVHGVMNTDNMTISGETIDYGPCAFIDTYHPKAVFSSIDDYGRYAYGQQPVIAQWNLARFAETLIPVINPDDPDKALETASALINRFPEIYQSKWLDEMRPKFGLSRHMDGDVRFINQFHELMLECKADFTNAFRGLADAMRGREEKFLTLFNNAEGAIQWVSDWRAHVADSVHQPVQIANKMDQVNPVYIPRNHKVEEALKAASDEDDMQPFRRLLAVVTNPFLEKAEYAEYAKPAPPDYGPHITYCGT